MHKQKFEATLAVAEELGSWAAYASYMLGEADTGDEDFNYLLAELRTANEKVQLRANQLSLKHNVRYFTPLSYGPS